MNHSIKGILQDLIDDIYQGGEYIYQAKTLEKVLDRIDKTINKLNTVINIENKESSYDRFFGDNTYLINELKNIKNILEGDDNND